MKNIVTYVLQAITHRKDQRKRRKRENAERKALARHDDHQSWADDLTEVSKTLLNKTPASELRKKLRDTVRIDILNLDETHKQKQGQAAKERQKGSTE